MSHNPKGNSSLSELKEQPIFLNFLTEERNLFKQRSMDSLARKIVQLQTRKRTFGQVDRKWGQGAADYLAKAKEHNPSITVPTTADEIKKLKIRIVATVDKKHHIIFVDDKFMSHWKNEDDVYSWKDIRREMEAEPEPEKEMSSQLS